MSTTSATYAAAFDRWREQCRDLPADVMADVERAWADAEHLSGDPGRVWEVALIELSASLIRARDQLPGDLSYWQDPLLLAWRTVRTARLLADRQRGFAESATNSGPPTNRP